MLVGYMFIYLIVNYWISKYYFVYVLDGYLVLNNNYLNLLVIFLIVIFSIEIDKVVLLDEYVLCLGNGFLNVKFIFLIFCCYYNLMVMLIDYVEEVYLFVDILEVFKIL